MSLADVFAEVDALKRAYYMREAWGHLEAPTGTQHAGRFTFINGQHGNMCVIESDFQTFGEGPQYFSDRAAFIWDNIKNGGVCSHLGVYQFDGVYVVEEDEGYFVGQIRKIHGGFVP